MSAGHTQYALRNAVINWQLGMQAVGRKITDYALRFDIHCFLTAFHTRVFRERKVQRRQRPVILLRRGKHCACPHRIHALLEVIDLRIALGAVQRNGRDRLSRVAEGAIRGLPFRDRRVIVVFCFLLM